MGGAAIRAACLEVASQVTVTGGGRGDGVTMATVQTAAKAMAMAQVGVVQMVVAGVPSHYRFTTSHEPTLFGKTTGIQATAR